MYMDYNRVAVMNNLILGLGLTVLGAVLLMTRALDVHPWQYLWPFFIIAPGLLFFAFMAAGGRNAGILAVPGSIMTMIGLILLYQTISGHWQSWAYIWTLIFPTAVGLGIMIQGVWIRQESIVLIGEGLFQAGLVIFMFATAVFELVFNISGFRTSIVGRFVWPGLLIALGLFLLVSRGGTMTGKLVLGQEPASSRAEEK